MFSILNKAESWPCLAFKHTIVLQFVFMQPENPRDLVVAKRDPGGLVRWNNRTGEHFDAFRQHSRQRYQGCESAIFENRRQSTVPHDEGIRPGLRQLDRSAPFGCTILAVHTRLQNPTRLYVFTFRKNKHANKNNCFFLQVNHRKIAQRARTQEFLRWCWIKTFCRRCHRQKQKAICLRKISSDTTARTKRRLGCTFICPGWGEGRMWRCWKNF